jgi:DNA replication protein DnaC
VGARYRGERRQKGCVMNEENDFKDRLFARLRDIGDDLERLEYFLPKEEIDRNTARNARRERLERAKPAITEEFFDAIIEGSLDETDALRTVKTWLGFAFGPRRPETRTVPRMLVLSGEIGRGKTVAGAYAIANEVGVYITAGELRRLRNSYNEQDISELRRAHTARLVVLDDLGAEGSRGDDEEFFFEFINARQGRVYTLITTNLTPQEIEARYGPRAFDRIHHSGGFKTVRGENLRRRRRAANE